MVKAEIPAAPGRKARVAELAVRFSRVALCKPMHASGAQLPATIALTLVDVRETSKPQEGEAIHWRLLTTHEVTSLGRACRIIELYRLRWIIEEFFHTLKTAGFDIEAADIGDPQVMIKFVTAATVAAVTVMQLVKARDGTTGQSLPKPSIRPISRSSKPSRRSSKERRRGKRILIRKVRWDLQVGSWGVSADGQATTESQGQK